MVTATTAHGSNYHSQSAVVILSGISILIGAKFLAASAVGLWKFIQADYFTDPGPYGPSWVGYDVNAFIGLVFFTFCTTPGVVLVFSGTRSLATAALSPKGIGIIGIVPYIVCSIIAMAGGMFFLVHWGGDPMKCLFAFCVDVQKYRTPKQPDAGFGWMSVVGISMGFSLIPIGIVSFTSAAYRLRNRNDNSNSHGGAFEPLSVIDGGALYVPLSSKLGSSGSNVMSRLIIIVVAVILLLVLFFVTLYVPNSWEYFVSSRIAHNAASYATINFTDCSTNWQVASCPEYPWATFRTVNWYVSEYLIAKVYPSNVFFYLYLVTVLLVTAVIVVTDNVHSECSFFHRRFRLPFLSSWSYKEALITALTIVAACLFFSYWLHDHNFNGLWTGGDDNTLANRGIADSEHWARALGQLSMFFLGLLFFPASRLSVMHHVLGTSWEGLLWAHRVLGYAMICTAIAHMFAWWYRMSELGLFSADIIAVPMTMAESIDNFTVPLATLGTFVLIICMGFLALNPVRRWWFELFYYSHLFAAYILIPIVLWHAAAGWEYLLPGLTVWFIDRCIRFARSSRKVHILGLEVLADGYTCVRFYQKEMLVRAGQYVFINLPRLGLFEWHPFTVVSGSAEDGYSLIIRNQGRGTWTDRLHSLATDARLSNQSVNSFVGEANCDGPYGHTIDYSRYSHVRFFCAGIGVTPGAAIISAMGFKHPDITLTWVVREKEFAVAMLPYLSHGNTKIHIYVSSVKTEVDVECVAEKVSARDDGITVHAGRPLLSKTGFDDIDTGSTLVFVCGPEDMVSALETSVDGMHNVVFHRETFFL